MKRKILIVSNSDDAHADVVAKRLSERSTAFTRLDSDRFIDNQKTWVRTNGRNLTFECGPHPDVVSKVWYRKMFFPEGDSPTQSFIRQELRGLFNSILGMYENLVWVNDRAALKNSRLELLQLKTAEDFGFLIPKTIVTNSVQELMDFYKEHGCKIVAKPIHAQVIGIGESALVVGTRTVTPAYFKAATEKTPCFAQEKLSIAAEYRIIVFGVQLFGFRLTPLVPVDDLKQATLEQIRHEAWPVEDDLARKIIKLTQTYGLLFAAIDLVETRSGDVVFLELNPNGQWLWLQYMTSTNLLDPFIDFLLE